MKYMRRLMRDMKLEEYFLTSKSFDKVWHKGLILKLEQNGISRKLLRPTKGLLSDRKQRIVLMDNAPLGWMSQQEFLKVLYLDL